MLKTIYFVKVVSAEYAEIASQDPKILSLEVKDILVI